MAVPETAGSVNLNLSYAETIQAKKGKYSSQSWQIKVTTNLNNKKKLNLKTNPTSSRVNEPTSTTFNQKFKKICKKAITSRKKCLKHRKKTRSSQISDPRPDLKAHALPVDDVRIGLEEKASSISYSLVKKCLWKKFSFPIISPLLVTKSVNSAKLLYIS